MSSLVVEMDLLLSRRLRLSNSCPSFPVPARWPALGRRGVHLYVCGMSVVYVWLIYAGGRGLRWRVTPEGVPMGDCLANPHLGVAKELLLRSRGGGRGVVCWAGRAFNVS